MALAQLTQAAQLATAKRERAELDFAEANLRRQEKLLRLGSGQKSDVIRAEAKARRAKSAEKLKQQWRDSNRPKAFGVVTQDFQVRRLLRDHDVAALDRPRQIGPENRNVAEIHRDSRAAQFGFIGDLKMKMWFG